MTKVKKFKFILPRKRLKKKKQRRSADKRNIPNNLNPLTNANTQSRRVLNSIQSDPDDFKQKDDNSDKMFSCFEVIDNDKENEFMNFTGDDPSNISAPINIDVNDSFFENEKIS